MSIQEPPPEVAANGNQRTAEGSPAGGTVRDEKTDEGGPGADAESGLDRESVKPSREDASVLVDRLAEAEAELERHRQGWTKLERDPKLARRVATVLGGRDDPESENEGPVAAIIEKYFPEKVRDAEGNETPNGWRNAMRELTAAIRAELREESDAKLETRMRDVDSTLSSSKMQRAWVNLLMVPGSPK